MLTHTTISSRLGYCKTPCVGLPSKTSQKLPSLQNNDHVSPVCGQPFGTYNPSVPSNELNTYFPPTLVPNAGYHLHSPSWARDFMLIKPHLPENTHTSATFFRLSSSCCAPCLSGNSLVMGFFCSRSKSLEQPMNMGRKGNSTVCIQGGFHSGKYAKHIYFKRDLVDGKFLQQSWLGFCSIPYAVFI